MKMRAVRLRDFIRPNPAVAGPGETVQSAASLMANASATAVPVMEGGRLIGILTDRDISQKVVAKRLDPASTLVAEIMSDDPVRISDDRDVESALLVMRARGVQELIVQDFAGTFLGIVCGCDLCNCQWEEVL